MAALKMGLPGAYATAALIDEFHLRLAGILEAPSNKSEAAMATLSMQAVVGRKTIHVVLMGDIATVNIFVTDNDDGSHQSQIMKVRQYLNAGMTNESVAGAAPRI
ncbi:hypothetical protein [Burkholderia multivorans]|uniref:hypothetical protein n=1 Tax=Burkholderia multivorans TaxID=87883 RepID=UPI0035101A43